MKVDATFRNITQITPSSELSAYTSPRKTAGSPGSSDEHRAEVERQVPRLIDLKGGRTVGLRALLDWLQTEVGVGKVSEQRLSNLADLSADELLAEVRKLRPKKAGLSGADVKRLKGGYTTSDEPSVRLVREADALDRRVSDVVNAAYGLIPAEVKLMWETAPHRMPFPAPAGGGG